MPHSIAGTKSSQGAVKDEPMDDTGIPSSIGQPAGDDDVDMDEDEDTDGVAVKNEVKLIDLFAGDYSDDEEFPSSAPVKHQPSSPPARIEMPTYVTNRCIYTILNCSRFPPPPTDASM